MAAFQPVPRIQSNLGVLVLRAAGIDHGPFVRPF